jgi:succinyl-CoA synthetase alpha subunit
LDDALHKVDELLKEKVKAVAEMAAPKSLESALEVLPGVNLVVISVPGQFAALEAKVGLQRNLNAFLFSDNAPPEDEMKLKKIWLGEKVCF